MYRTIETAFWTDPRIVALKPDGKLLCLYLVTNPHAHVSGIYYLPDTIVSHETGLSASRVDTLWDTLSSAGFSRRDKKREVIWVLRMFFYQGRGSKNERAAAKHIQTLHKSSLVNDFLAAYPAVQRWFSDRVSIGYPKLDESGTQEQEQEQEQEQDQDQEGISAQPPVAIGFDAFWTAYPRKVAKQEAQDRFAKVVKLLKSELRGDGFDPLAFLVERATAFAKSPKGQAGQFCPYPATWLNRGSYDDDPKAWEDVDDGQRNRTRSPVGPGQRYDPQAPTGKF